uniref:Uracil-DNA glycosylase n=1 Tax=Pithovirus LCPAC001 TaxID=2506585 RepID=A0A481Z2G2_9VIRU|nr:MAG: uracil-DNA glycosylase [Pithovirus LCPAC001]
MRNSQPVANGLAFSTEKGLRIQPSLRNIYKELERTIPEFEMPEHGDLRSWAKQGVLLLNSALTTIKNKAGAHTDYWSGFTTYIINVINKVKPDCIYMLWGLSAGKIKKYIHNTKYILQSNHPSPMVRNSNFKGNNHFLQANTLLKLAGKKEIDWRLD